MGCYDTVQVTCPSCHSGIDLQSKAGKCEFIRYDHPLQAPTLVQADLDKHEFSCPGCHRKLQILMQMTANPILVSRDHKEKDND